jgi:HK97 family phage prohead protease
MLKAAKYAAIVTSGALELKRADALITSVAGEFEGYASLFGATDLGGDIVERGAFQSTLEKRGAPLIKMLWQHDGAEPIGRWLSIVEDAKGLKVRGRLNLAVARAREALALMRDGAVDGLSIGFRTVCSTKDKLTGGRRLRQLDLLEISLVTFPMLPRARVMSIKRTALTSEAYKRRYATAALCFDNEMNRLRSLG